MARELAGLLGPLRVPEVLTIALASGVGEELLFRGALQPWIGLLPASILFALLHPPIRPGLEAWPWLALGAGLGMGLLAVWSGGLLAPIGFHVALNAGNMAWIVSMEEACEPDTSSSPP
jgi:membrane protease YdiL (CAAX protease family)